MGSTLQAQLTKSATRASANSTENTAACLVSLPCAMSKLFERLELLLHHLVAERITEKPTGSEPTQFAAGQQNRK
jgi:hypothetical protein